MHDANDEFDRDSAIGSLTSNASTSLHSSVVDYQFENGRRYHAYKEGAYPLPNDETEQDRLDLLHHIWRLSKGGALYAAPVKTPHRILDLGTGTGIWALDLADDFPESTIIGVDLSEIQPRWVPPNVQFYVDDVEEPWTWKADEKFDLIHMRNLSGFIKDFPKLYAQALEHLKPGGWFEYQDYNAWYVNLSVKEFLPTVL